ncbi:MAG: PQQ-binding-like beta-propeller repeat protein [Marinicellaceae bacterium]
MSHLYLGIKGSVVCIEKSSGKELWSTKLKSMHITNIICLSGQIFAYTKGHLFCIDKDFGKIIWENSLPGYGYGPCIFATENNNQQQTAALSEQQVATDAQAATVTTTT